MLPEVRYHMDIVHKVIGTRHELWIAREVSCKTSETVSVLLRLSNEKGQDMEFLIELASGWNGGMSPRHGRTEMGQSYTGGLSPSARYTPLSAAQADCGVKNGDLRGL